jgi:hypothetical protein
MLDILDISRRFPNQWVVLENGRRVVDHGPELPPLRARHQGARRTFYLAAVRT